MPATMLARRGEEIYRIWGCLRARCPAAYPALIFIDRAGATPMAARKSRCLRLSCRATAGADVVVTNAAVKVSLPGD